MNALDRAIKNMDKEQINDPAYAVEWISGWAGYNTTERKCFRTKKEADDFEKQLNRQNITKGRIKRYILKDFYHTR